MADQEFKTGRLRKIVYGFGCVGDGGWYQLMSTFLLYFYVTVVKLDPWLTSLAFALSFGVWNAINDPIVGGLSDRTRSRWGRRKPWIAIGALLCLAFSFLIWTPPIGSSLANPYNLEIFFYALVTIAVAEFTYTMCAVPFLAIMPETFTNIKERSEVAAIRNSWGIVGGMIAMVVFPALITSFSAQFGEIGAYVWAGTMTIAIFMLSFVVGGVLGGKERREFSAEKPLGFFESLKLTITNRSLLTYEAAHVMSYTSGVWLSAMAPFFIQASLGLTLDALGIVFLLNLVATVGFFFLWRKFCINQGARKSVAVSMVMFTLAMVPVLFVNDIITLAIWGAFTGASLGGVIIGREVIFGDIIDEDEVKCGRRREGSLLGVIVSMEKLSAVIVGVSTAVILSVFGYVQSLDVPHQPASVGWGIRLGMLGFQALYMAITLLSLKFYPLTKAKCDEIAQKLEEIHAEKAKKLQEQ